MHNLRSIVYALGAVAIVCSLAVFTLSATLVFATLLAGITVLRALSSRPKPVPVRARNDRQARRVWNDGRGTIIDI